MVFNNDDPEDARLKFLSREQAHSQQVQPVKINPDAILAKGHSRKSSFVAPTQKLSFEAVLQRNVESELLQRKRQLLLLQQQVEEIELQAKLAALKAHSVSGKSFRT